MHVLALRRQGGGGAAPRQRGGRLGHAGAGDLVSGDAPPNLPPLSDGAVAPLSELLTDPAVPKAGHGIKRDWLARRLAGVEPPTFTNDEATIPALKAVTAHRFKQESWRVLRPPLRELDESPRRELIEALDREAGDKEAGTS